MSAPTPRASSKSAAPARAARDPRFVRIDAKTVFPNYLQRGPVLSETAWDVLRAGALGVWLAVAFALLRYPDFGLRLLWGLIVPLVPAVVVLAPGLWRQICPMGLANQAPQRLGVSRGLTLPEPVRDGAFMIAVAAFVTVVALRQPFFNHVGPATGGLLIASLALAFAGGAIFKGRSGWCGTFCPLGPIQRVYGAAPLAEIAQSQCVTCVGCQKNCYDFNPVASGFDDIYDEDPRYAGQRRFFMAMIPGFVLGYFAQGPSPGYGYPIYLAILLLAPLASVGLYQFALSYLRVDPYRGAIGFAAFALIAFYWFAGPTVVNTVAAALDITAPAAALWASRSIGALAAASLWIVGARNNARYEEARMNAVPAPEAQAPTAGGHEVIVDGETYHANEGQRLLEVLKGGGAQVVANCQAGLCGSDAVYVREGAERLSAPTDDEAATLARIGLTGAARLACSVRVFGPVKLSRTPVGSGHSDGRTSVQAAGVVSAERLALASRSRRLVKPALVDRAARAGLNRVVVIGNGVAGVTVADELRKASAGVEISLVSVEPHHFYNRMALNKIVEGKCEASGLVLQGPAWFAEHRIDTALDMRVEAIDRAASRVALEGGQTLPYDRLVIAAGARARVPFAAFLARANCFVLRSMADAERLRDYVRQMAPRSCAVIGAGVLGVEAAETLARLGVAVTLIARGRRLMERNLDDEAADLLHRHLMRMGVEVALEADAQVYEGDEMLRAIVFKDGRTVHADMFVACLGQTPNAELARDCGLETGRGVIVNPLMMTNDSNIYAVGDVAELRGSGEGLWPIAIAQARTAVASMLGMGERYVEPRVVMRLKSDTIELRSFGALAARPDDEIMCAPPFTGDWWRVVVRDGHIAGAVFAGPGGRTSPLWDLVQSNADVAPYRDNLQHGRIENIRVAAGEAA